ncbi:hypothetical protein ACOME3_002717 [Neoechinorhynchus agilis]
MTTSSKKHQTSRLNKLRSILYNNQKRTVLGRGCLAWAQIALFYCVFYAFLAAFFAGMLFVVRLLTPIDRPLYFMGESAMASIYALNPGVGFRPQPDVQSESITFAKSSNQSGPLSYIPYVQDIDNYLNQFYQSSDDKTEKCANGESPSESQKSCIFEMDASGECTSANKYGYPQGRPCVLVKLNRLYGWKSGGMPRCPEEDEIGDGKGNLGTGGDIRIKCAGETAADRDNIQSIQYFSYSGKSGDCGSLPNSPSFYPFLSQKDYQTPYVFVQFDTTPNTIVSILCRAYGDNIDNGSKLPMRGMTRFKVFQQSEKSVGSAKTEEL